MLLTVSFHSDTCLNDGSANLIGIVAAREVHLRVLQLIEDHGGHVAHTPTAPVWLVDFDVTLSLTDL